MRGEVRRADAFLFGDRGSGARRAEFHGDRFVLFTQPLTAFFMKSHDIFVVLKDNPQNVIGLEQGNAFERYPAAECNGHKFIVQHLGYLFQRAAYHLYFE